MSSELKERILVDISGALQQKKLGQKEYESIRTNIEPCQENELLQKIREEKGRSKKFFSCLKEETKKMFEEHERLDSEKIAQSQTNPGAKSVHHMTEQKKGISSDVSPTEKENNDSGKKSQIQKKPNGQSPSTIDASGKSIPHTDSTKTSHMNIEELSQTIRDKHDIQKLFPSHEWKSLINHLKEYIQEKENQETPGSKDDQNLNTAHAEQTQKDTEKPPDSKKTKGLSKPDGKTIVEGLQKHLQVRDSALDSYEKEMENILKNLEDKTKEMTAELKTMTEDRDKLKQEKKKLLDDVNKLNVEKINTVTIMDTLKDDIEQLKSEKAGCEMKITELQDDCMKLFNKNKKLELNIEQQKKTFSDEMKVKNTQMDELKKEKDDYRDRFSKMAGDKLTDNNADIADLSDPNRAMKLAEKFSSMYDDEWTDAYTTLSDNKMPTKDAIQLLLRILKSCYDGCDGIAADQLEKLKKSLLFPVQKEEKEEKSATKDKAGVKEPRLSSKNEKILRDARRQMCEVSIDAVRKTLLEQTKDWMAKEMNPRIFDDTKAYTEKCVEICWLMVIHEPPVYLRMEIIPGDKMDPTHYTAFSASGKKIDYLVWPPLYNGKGGGLLGKGVVELQKTVTKDAGKKK